MNDLERRTLLSAAGIGALAALSKAGPLDPPAGSVSPTGRTLDEVYNKIPAPGSPPIGAYDNRIAIPGGTTLVTINQPGSYVLTGDVIVGGNSRALEITASNVTLDLNGFTLGNANPTGGTTLYVGTNANTGNIVVRNGKIAGGFNGVLTASLVSGVVLEDLTIRGIRFFGINTNGKGARIRRCSVFETAAGVSLSHGQPVAAISASGGSAVSVEDCLVAGFSYSGTPSASQLTGFRIICTGAFIARNTVTNDAAVTGVGFQLNGTGIYRDNCSIYMSSPYAGAGFGNGGGNV